MCCSNIYLLGNISICREIRFWERVSMTNKGLKMLTTPTNKGAVSV